MHAIRSSSEATGIGGPPGDSGMARTKRPRGRRGRTLGARIRALVGVVALVLLGTAALASTASAALPQMGPVDANDTKFPTWYGDSNGLALQLCLDGLPNCLAAHTDLIEAHAAGGDGEGFYYAADADVGPVTVSNHLEAAYAADGVDQEITFMRTQISDQTQGTLTAGGKYTITDPYGVLSCTADALGEIRNNACRTETTIVPLEFARAQAGRIGPFLTWDTYGQPLGGLNPPPPGGYIGDNTTPHKVTGSPNNFNMVRIEGPGINKATTDACPTVASAISDCAETDLFTIQGKVQPSASASTDTTALDYGNVPTGTPVTKTIKYTSTGAQPVTVTSLTVGGTDAADFAVGAETCTTATTATGPGLASGSTCTIDVTYTPRAGTSAATLTIADNTAGNPRTIKLSGSSTPHLTLDRTSVAFGNQKIKTASAPEIVTVGNDGVAPLTITNAALSGTGSAHFKIDSN